MISESIATRRLRLLREYPEYCTASDVARALKITRGGVRHHASKIKHIEVDGMTLYHRAALGSYVATFVKNNDAVSRRIVRGIDVERLQRICECYYRTQYDTADPELLRLAKRLADL